LINNIEEIYVQLVKTYKEKVVFGIKKPEISPIHGISIVFIVEKLIAFVKTYKTNIKQTT
jgi:hypothetical protein